MDPKWRYKSELRDLIKYHRYGEWAIPLLVAFPGLSRRIVEGLGGMLRTNPEIRSIDPASQDRIMLALSSIVPPIASSKLVQRAAFGIVGK